MENFRVLIIKGMKTLSYSFQNYSDALQFKMENGGTIYQRIYTYYG